MRISNLTRQKTRIRKFALTELMNGRRETEEEKTNIIGVPKLKCKSISFYNVPEMHAAT